MTDTTEVTDATVTAANIATPTTSRSIAQRARDLVVRHPLRAVLWAIVLAALPAVIALRLRPPPPEPMPVYGTVPAFTLTDQSNRSFGLDNLRGHVWIADFFFTTCPSICPRLTRHLKRIQDRTADLGDRVRFVSFSVDPIVDTPEVLTAYAHRYGANLNRWSFVRGPIESIKHVSIDGFRVALEENLTPVEARSQQFNILHGGHILLVDRQGRIRQYFRAVDEDLDTAVDAARRLASE